METISIENDYRFSQVTDDSQVNEIKGWLIEERSETGGGFYCNWKIIQSAIDDGFCFILRYRDHTIGFLTWSNTTEFTARIVIAEIKPSHRGLSAGRTMVTQFLKYLSSKKFVIVDLECSPSSSVAFWRKMGFIEFPLRLPDFLISEYQRLYFLLTEPLPSSQASDFQDVFELWMKEPYQIAVNEKASISWNLDSLKGSLLLSKPIIYPAKNEWRVRWQNEGKIVSDCKVKHFKKEIGYEDFIVIYELPVI
jgi:ribosomal protein S18 acetylase RimI-like enzyme